MARHRLPFTLRPATADDEEALYRLKRDTLRPYVERTWGWDEADQRLRHREAFTGEGVRIVERDGALVGAFRAFRKEDRLLVAWILVRPEHQSRGLGTRILRLIQKQADRSRFPVELHVLRVNDRARALYERLAFRVVATNDTHHVMRWEGRRTARHERRARRRAARRFPRRELTLGPHEWLLLLGSVLAGQQMVPLGITVAIGLSALVAVALILHALKKRASYGRLLLRVGWMTRATAIILGVAFVFAAGTLVESDRPAASRLAPLAAGLALLFFAYAPRTMEVRRRGVLLPFRRGWVRAGAVAGFRWRGEAGDELTIELTPDGATGLPREYRREMARHRRPAIDAALEAMLAPE